MMIGDMMSKNVEEAIKLLRDDNLVWSDDFEQIRVSLVNVLVEILELSNPIPVLAVETLAEILIASDSDALIPWPAKDETNSRIYYNA